MQNKTSMAARKSYRKELKFEAIRLTNEQGVAKTSRDLDIGVNLIYPWHSRLVEDKKRVFPGSGNPRNEELSLLKRRNDRFQEEVAILKGVRSLLQKPPMRYQFIKDYRGRLALSV